MIAVLVVDLVGSPFMPLNSKYYIEFFAFNNQEIGTRLIDFLRGILHNPIHLFRITEAHAPLFSILRRRSISASWIRFSFVFRYLNLSPSLAKLEPRK